MLTRYLSAISTGSLITLSLLFVMQFLITMDANGTVVVRDSHYLDWVRVPEPEPLVPLPEPFDREDLTRTEVPPDWSYPKPSGLIINVSNGNPGRPQTILPPMPKFVDGPLVTIVRVSPVYPVRMSQQGIEGYVVVEFDVMTNGRVSDARVVESSHKGFEKSALAAAMKMKFKPRVVDGVALVSEGIQNKFSYEME